MACLTGCSKADRNAFRDSRGVCQCLCVGERESRERERGKEICHFFLSVVRCCWHRMPCVCFPIHIGRRTLPHTHLSFPLPSVNHDLCIAPQLLITYLQSPTFSDSLLFDIRPYHPVGPSPQRPNCTVYACITTSGS